MKKLDWSRRREENRRGRGGEMAKDCWQESPSDDERPQREDRREKEDPVKIQGMDGTV